ncbi:Stromal cell-derived factor 2-like protein 1 [Dissostichus eleginoides]|uniref:Stromal cell-derived factor 2-like protein 1 n=1 Tax=Dissostichus eleginoides TaxID=100907 RepID=A0AAD9C092_DISEL|nr:Stromal cell-derived factor 2-like protein 1 [Dissostichus eleginoides]
MEILHVLHVFVRSLMFLLLWSKCEGRESELNHVTCGSLLKLLNTRHNVRLHSHDVKYGSAAAHAVRRDNHHSDSCLAHTPVSAPWNHLSYYSWTFHQSASFGAPTARGEAVKCGQGIRITHMKTGRNLHTHHFSSPLSNNQEVSAFGENGEGDNLDVWTVQCDGIHWEREEDVRFKHVGTDVFLSVTGEQYGHPIRGQREVHGMSSANQNNWWRSMEGVFLQPSQMPLRHDEL